jgi:enolase
MKSAIESVYAIQVLDSRGNPTVAVRARLADGSEALASVPSGASTGEFEAVELRDGDSSRYLGKGVLKAVANINGPIAKALAGMNAAEQSKIDQCLLDLDGTRNKGKLGANAILGASLAVARAAAISAGVELFEYLGQSRGVQLPVPLVNVINGGAHANNSLDIQEFMIVPHGAPTFAEAIRMSAETFHALGALLKNDGYSTAVGDEGGYAPRLESTSEAFDLLLAAIERAGYKPGEQISLALDVAASELVKEGPGEIRYKFAKEDLPEMSASEIIGMYAQWAKQYPIVSIEDGLGENDWAGWKELTERLGSEIQLVGDDLFVTNVERISRGIQEKISNSVLIKLNQIGSVTETMNAISTSIEAGYTTVISHRSGETDDATISDLAVAVNSGQIKTGSICRGERIAKYNRLLWIEDRLGSKAQFKNPF